MPYDTTTADRVRKVLKRRQGVTEKKLFGGLAFMIDGNMACGVLNRDLVLRLGEEGAADALKEPGVREMDFTGRPMKTMVYVGLADELSDAELKEWVLRGVTFARSLPAK